MKTAPQRSLLAVQSHFITSPSHQLSVSVKILLTGSILTGTLLITGCQSTNLGQSSALKTAENLAASNTPTAAKAAWVNALQQQRRQSFTYHSNFEISNDQQFTAIDTTSLVASDDVDSYCEDTHDQSYAALLTQAKAQSKDILASDYHKQREALKQSYLECAEAYQAWEDDHYDSTATVTDVAAEVYNEETDDYSEAPAEADVSHAVASSKPDNESSAYTVSPYYETLFTEYDNKQSTLDVKKAQLLDAYLLKPLSMNAQGVYQPLAGKFTMLSSAQYQTRNHHSSINQPIYVDLKNGNIYLWADNFALLNSELLDNKLGTQWQNKWLKIALDDGSLPKGFGRAVIKSHFTALDNLYNKAPITQFNYIAPNTLATLAPKLPEQQLAAMLQSQQVIRRVQDFDSYQQSYKNYMRTFYQLIGNQYPELIIDSETAEQNNQSDTDADKVTFTSKFLVQQVLVMMKGMIDNDSGIDDVPSSKTANTSAPIQELYGFDKRGHLVWQHSRQQLPTSRTTQDKSKDNVTIDVLQQYMPIRAQDAAFPNLPSNMQIPNARNSVDLRDYSKELAAYYRDGNGTSMGKMLFNMLPIYKNRFGMVE